MQHPDYPIEFKPVIAAYDWDQTYDILGFSYLPAGFENLMTFFNIPAYETLAVDRFTPYDYLWAINYSDYLYSFLGYFNYCPFNSIARRTANDIDDFPLIVNNTFLYIDEFNYFNNFFSVTNFNYFITIPKGKVKITWLTNNGIKQGIINEIYTLNQCLINFNFEQNTQIDLLTIQEDFNVNFCSNSLVFSQLINDQWVEFTPQGINNNFLLYRDIQEYFWEVQQELIAYFDFVHTNYFNIEGIRNLGYDTFSIYEKRITVSNVMPLKTYLKTLNQNFTFSIQPTNDFRLEMVNYSLQPQEVFYDYFPYFLSNLFFLQRANNNKWGLGVQLQDQGVTPKPNRFLDDNNFLYFNAYNSHIDQNQLSFERDWRLFQGVYSNLYYPVYPSLTDQQQWSYIVNLDMPKNSVYLWDYPLFDIRIQWKSDQIYSFFTNTIHNDFYTTYYSSSIVNKAYKNFGEDTGIAPLIYTRLENLFILYPYISATDYTYFDITLWKDFFGAAHFISPYNPYIYFYSSPYRHSFFKQIISSFYELEWFHSKNIVPNPVNPDMKLFKYESILVKTVTRLPYSLFDIVNEQSPSDYTSFEYIGGYIGTREEYSTDPYPFFESNFAYDENHDNYISFELWTEQEYQNLYNYGIISDSDYLFYLQNLKIQVETNMVDSVRLKEIHSCLGASEFSYINNEPTTPIYMHMARKLDYMAKALGLAFNGDGSIMGIRQSKALENGETIPAGWNFGQFGRNEGNNLSNNAQQGGNTSEERLGIVYDVRSNKFIKNPASGEEDIKQGGYILCESIPQMLHIMLDDLDRALGLQTLGAIAITNQNYNDDYNGGDLSIKTPYYKYNGLGDAFVEVMHTLADTHKQAFQANIGSLKSQAITIEILGALGVGCLEKTIILDIDDQPVKILYPAFNRLTPSITDLHMWTLTNQSFLNEVNS